MTIVFVDESGFYLLPFTSRTYAPKKETPVLRHKLSHEHLSVISGITEQGRLYIQIREESFKGPAVVEFLRHLLKHIPGKLLVIWDGSPIHRSQDVKTFLSEGANGRLQLERLPPYSPDLNPDEGVWQYLKCVCLKNICCKDLSHLKRELKRAIRTLRSRKHVITGCFKRMEYV
jgi:transposase